jgi:hypothetical protein
MEALGYRLEQYSLRHPREVLVVHSQWEGQLDEILVFRGFSSSLIQSTDADPDVPVLDPEAHVIGIDRCQAPYSALVPKYLERGITAAMFADRLEALGL